MYTLEEHDGSPLLYTMYANASYNTPSYSHISLWKTNSSDILKLYALLYYARWAFLGTIYNTLFLALVQGACQAPLVGMWATNFGLYKFKICIK